MCDFKINDELSVMPEEDFLGPMHTWGNFIAQGQEGVDILIDFSILSRLENVYFTSQATIYHSENVISPFESVCSQLLDL